MDEPESVKLELNSTALKLPSALLEPCPTVHLVSKAFFQYSSSFEPQGLSFSLLKRFVCKLCLLLDIILLLFAGEVGAS